MKIFQSWPDLGKLRQLRDQKINNPDPSAHNRCGWKLENFQLTHNNMEKLAEEQQNFKFSSGTMGWVCDKVFLVWSILWRASITKWETRDQVISDHILENEWTLTSWSAQHRLSSLSLNKAENQLTIMTWPGRGCCILKHFSPPQTLIIP